MFRGSPAFVEAAERPPPLCIATTVVLSCHNRHLVLPQRTSRLATPEIRRGKTGCDHRRIGKASAGPPGGDDPIARNHRGVIHKDL